MLLTGLALLGLWLCFNIYHWESLILAGHCQTCSFSMEEATTCLGSSHRPRPVYWLPGPPSQWEPLELCSGSDTVAPLFLWCAGSELVIKAADVSLGRGCIHVYAGWGERQWGLLYWLLHGRAGVTFQWLLMNLWDGLKCFVGNWSVTVSSEQETYI